MEVPSPFEVGREIWKKREKTLPAIVLTCTARMHEYIRSLERKRNGKKMEREGKYARTHGEGVGRK